MKSSRTNYANDVNDSTAAAPHLQYIDISREGDVKTRGNHNGVNIESFISQTISNQNFSSFISFKRILLRHLHVILHVTLQHRVSSNVIILH
jgi:hypothetical protein